MWSYNFFLFSLPAGVQSITTVARASASSASSATLCPSFSKASRWSLSVASTAPRDIRWLIFARSLASGVRLWKVTSSMPR